jgi:hypothetical protein
MVSKTCFACFSLPHPDGNFFLRPDRILGAFHIDSSTILDLNTLNESLEKLEVEMGEDGEESERLKQNEKKLRQNTRRINKAVEKYWPDHHARYAQALPVKFSPRSNGGGGGDDDGGGGSGVTSLSNTSSSQSEFKNQSMMMGHDDNDDEIEMQLISEFDKPLNSIEPTSGSEASSAIANKWLAQVGGGDSNMRIKKVKKVSTKSSNTPSPMPRSFDSSSGTTI